MLHLKTLSLSLRMLTMAQCWKHLTSCWDELICQPRWTKGLWPLLSDCGRATRWSTHRGVASVGELKCPHHHQTTIRQPQQIASLEALSNAWWGDTARIIQSSLVKTRHWSMEHNPHYSRKLENEGNEQIKTTRQKRSRRHTDCSLGWERESQIVTSVVTTHTNVT